MNQDKMSKRTVKAITLKGETIQYIEGLAQIEHRNFSNMIDVIIQRYKKISEQLDQGRTLDTLFAK